MTYRFGLTDIKHTRRSLNKVFQSCSLLESARYTSKSLLIMAAWWWRVRSSSVKFWSPELDADMVSRQGKQVGRQLWAGSYSAAEFHLELPDPRQPRILFAIGSSASAQSGPAKPYRQCPKRPCETLSRPYRHLIFLLWVHRLRLCYVRAISSDQPAHCNLQSTMQGGSSKTGDDKFEENVRTFKLI